MKKTKQKVTFYSVLVNGVVIKDFKSHDPASAYKNKKLGCPVCRTKNALD